MADLIFNIARGSIAERVRRVRANDPTGCALVVVVIAAGGPTDATIRDLDTLADILAQGDEPTNAGYGRKVLVAANLTDPVVDDTQDRVTCDLPDLTWQAVAAGDEWERLIVCYRPSSAATDAQHVPLSAHDFSIAPNGGDVYAVVDAAGFYRSQ